MKQWTLLTLICLSSFAVWHFAEPVHAQDIQTGAYQVVTIKDLADITGDGSTHAISAAPLYCSWVEIVAPAANTALLRIGSSSISATQGISVAPGGGYMLPILSDSRRRYDLSAIYYRAANGDKLNVQYIP